MQNIIYLVLFFFFFISQAFAIENIAVTMHQEERVCPLIAKLKEQLKTGNSSSLEEFWEEVEVRTTPLIDPIEGNDSEMLTTFVWRSKKDHANVVVASYGISSFDPFKNEMVHLPGTDVWYKSWILPRNTRTVYCISPDDPLISISDYHLDQLSSRFNQSWTQDPLNPKIYFIPGYLCLGEVDKKMSLLEMPDAPSFPWKNEDEYSRGLVLDAYSPSSILEEGREVYIYLPPDYDRNRTKPYPLVVTFDGDIFKDFIEAPAIFDFLIKEGKIPPLIAVMIRNPKPNMITRFRDLACHEPFIDFVANELITWTRKNYRVTEDPSQTVIAGGSLGAVISTYMGLVHPEIFGNIIAEVGTYWWPIKGEQDWLIQQYVKSPKQDLRFFLDVGSLETVPTFSNGSSILNSNRHFRDVLRAKGYSVKYVEFAGGHDFICMQHTFAEGLQYLLDRHLKKRGNMDFTVEEIIDFTETWLTQGDLNSNMLAKNFEFVSPFWKSNSREDFINKFQNTSTYQETSLSKITKFDPIIKLKGLDGSHFALILQYHTKNNSSVYEAVLGKIVNGLLVELRTIYDLDETKKALQLK